MMFKSPRCFFVAVALCPLKHYSRFHTLSVEKTCSRKRHHYNYFFGSRTQKDNKVPDFLSMPLNEFHERSQRKTLCPLWLLIAASCRLTALLTDNQTGASS